jgi:hypothetical protein
MWYNETKPTGTRNKKPDMNLTLNLRRELEVRLREKAAQDGVQPEVYALALLENQLAERPPSELTESELLLEAARGLPDTIWERYRELSGRQHQASLDPGEQSELLELNDLIETTHARRMGFVAELAVRRGMPLRQLMDELGFPNYGRI